MYSASSRHSVLAVYETVIFVFCFLNSNQKQAKFQIVAKALLIHVLANRNRHSDLKIRFHINSIAHPNRMQMPTFSIHTVFSQLFFSLPAHSGGYGICRNIIFLVLFFFFGKISIYCFVVLCFFSSKQLLLFALYFFSFNFEFIEFVVTLTFSMIW